MIGVFAHRGICDVSLATHSFAALALFGYFESYSYIVTVY